MEELAVGLIWAHLGTVRGESRPKRGKSSHTCASAGRERPPGGARSVKTMIVMPDVRFACERLSI